MKWYYVVGLLLVCLVMVFYFSDSDVKTRDVVRPEKIVSKREVIYDTDTYKKLADLWEKYNKVYPSEDAYANWMYALRYAGFENYLDLVDKGLKKYPANPVLLYLASLKKHGSTDNDIGRMQQEIAIAIDPTYVDPWFSLIINYMIQGDEERTNLALRNILDGHAITDEVMDFSYNMLQILEPNAILITNGDNDTYPAWILTRILNIRPDVTIVNRSLLNTEWYPIYLIERGVPEFITEHYLKELREFLPIYYKEQNLQTPSVGLPSDTLITMVIQRAVRELRPVYFAITLTQTDIVKRYYQAGRFLGLVTLVTPPIRSHKEDLDQLIKIWLKEFRTGGIDSWHLVHAKESDAGRKIVTNYAVGIWELKDSITAMVPELRQDLLNWMHLHVETLLPLDFRCQFMNWWGLKPTVDNHNRCPEHGSPK
jgi:hypothetical protein